MLPAVQGLFTLVGDLASGRRVTRIATSASLVQQHGIAPLAATSGAPQFKPDHARTALAWVSTTRQLHPVLDRLRAADVNVAPLKGFSYATTIYDHPSERPMNDVDLLVKQADESRARGILVDCGFALSSDAPRHHASTWVRDSLVIDLHRNIVGQGRSRIDLDAVWSRTAPADAQGLRRLDATDELVFHLVHLARNRLRGPLMHVVDFARLERRASTSEALARATAWGLDISVGLALRFCRGILGGNASRPAGMLGPSSEDIALLHDASVAQKLLFDLATAGSARQVIARIAGYADRLRVS
jgi:hypothetical protein